MQEISIFHLISKINIIVNNENVLLKRIKSKRNIDNNQNRTKNTL